ncbi:MAG: response regulator transcription factor [Bacteroidales bacterium]|nr:response regulator transcription factor [Bacteroidales bacterium]
MNVLILEDETRASSHLQRLIQVVAPEMRIVAVYETVRESVEYLQSNPPLSLVFSDVQLADGLSFEIFRQVDLQCPIIFTTAYDTYAIEAFNTNGIDYLLKPIEEERLKQAIDKARTYSARIDLNNLLHLTQLAPSKKTKSRFMVKVGERIKSIMVEDIKAFYSFDKATYLHTVTDRNYIIDYSLDELQLLLDSHRFFKINRRYIVSIDACSQIFAWSNSRLKLVISGIDDHKIVVAREKVQDFKQWLDR